MAKTMVGGVQVTTSKRTKTGNKHKFGGRNDGPARQRYWASRRLEERKIRNLMRHCGLTRADATARWRATRQGRVKFAV